MAIRRPLLVLTCLALLSGGCMTRSPAPVVERGSAPPPVPAATVKPAAKPVLQGPDTRAESYVVRAGDTLFSIALDNGLDYRELAAWNGIDNPSVIRVGQVLRLRPPAGAAVVSPAKAPPGAVEARPLGPPGAPVTAAPAPDGIKTQPTGVRVPYSDQAYAQLSKEPAAAQPKPDPQPKPEPRPEAAREAGDIDWAWPTRGKVIQGFNGTTAKGLAIAGKMGQPVTASAAGRVIYSGTGIRGLGRLLVIKHNDTFFSVYGHNSQLLVKEGQSVTRGQRIAEMGDSDADQVKLHFEIRRYGQPVDPAKLLPDNPA